MSGLDEPLLHLGPKGQIALGVADIARSKAFYGGVLALRQIYDAALEAGYDCGDVRLLLQQRPDPEAVRPASPIYFRVDDIRRARRELEARGVVFTEPVQLVANLRDCDLWMTYFADPDGHRLALMMEGPRGFAP
jgi:catechol 2,3-dioxygenase-like lactoylglutathione lyase family enzyme